MHIYIQFIYPPKLISLICTIYNLASFYQIFLSNLFYYFGVCKCVLTTKSRKRYFNVKFQ